MKKLVLALVGVVAVQSSFAQFSIDPEVGMNISKVRSKAGDADAVSGDGAVGFSVGAGLHLPLTKGLYLKPGLYYHMLGDKTELANVTSTTSMHYLRIPVNLGYNFRISEKAGAIFAEAGPYVGYALSGKTKVEGLPTGEVERDIEFGGEVTETNPLDWGFNFALGYETPWGVYVKGGYGLGLGNLSNIDDLKTTINHWNIGIGYRISL